MSVQPWPPKTYLFGDVWCFVGSKTVQNQKIWGKTTPQKVRKYPAKVRKYAQKCANQDFWTVPFSKTAPIWSITIQFDATLVPMGSKNSDCYLTVPVLFHNMCNFSWALLCSDTVLQNVGEDPGAILPTVCCPYIAIFDPLGEFGRKKKLSIQFYSGTFSSWLKSWLKRSNRTNSSESPNVQKFLHSQGSRYINNH